MSQTDVNADAYPSGSRTFRTIDVSRPPPQDVSHPSSRRFAPVALTTCPSLRRFASPCEMFRTHGIRFAPYEGRFAPY